MVFGSLVLGMARLDAGDAEAAIEPLDRGMRLNPHDPQNFVWHHLLALACLLSGEPDKALRNAMASLAIRPDWRAAMETAACCHAALGNREAARACVSDLAPIAELPGDALGPFRRANPQWVCQLDQLLQQAARA
jgi:Flp pilus assembly protein TadD